MAASSCFVSSLSNSFLCLRGAVARVTVSNTESPFKLVLKRSKLIPCARKTGYNYEERRCKNPGASLMSIHAFHFFPNHSADLICSSRTLISLLSPASLALCACCTPLPLCVQTLLLLCGSVHLQNHLN